MAKRLKGYQRAKKRVRIVTENTILTDQDLGTIIIVNSTDPIEITLPPGCIENIGEWVRIQKQNVGAMTIYPNSSDALADAAPNVPAVNSTTQSHVFIEFTMTSEDRWDLGPVTGNWAATSP